MGASVQRPLLPPEEKLCLTDGLPPAIAPPGLGPDLAFRFRAVQTAARLSSRRSSGREAVNADCAKKATGSGKASGY